MKNNRQVRFLQKSYVSPFSLMLSKKTSGNIPITILVIGVFAVCTLAMLSFFAASISSRNSFVGVDIIEDSNKNIEKGELNKFPIEVNKSRLSWDYVISGFKDELLFSIDYEKP